MIPVQEKPAPESFENAVRQKGLTFLRRIGAVMDQPLPAGIQLEREMRSRHYLEYREGFYSADFLKKRSPLVWQEAQRQGLL